MKIQQHPGELAISLVSNVLLSRKREDIDVQILSQKNLMRK
jgi:hypothetical protein